MTFQGKLMTSRKGVGKGLTYTGLTGHRLKKKKKADWDKRLGPVGEKRVRKGEKLTPRVHPPEKGGPPDYWAFE